MIEPSLNQLERGSKPPGQNSPLTSRRCDRRRRLPSSRNAEAGSYASPFLWEAEGGSKQDSRRAQSRIKIPTIGIVRG